MTRILSYNILVGGKGRVDQLERMIKSADPDIVGLVEATNQAVVKELAGRLNMDYRINAFPDGSWKPEIALLSRLPILYSEMHRRPVLRTRSLLEVGLQEEHGEKLTVFITHLTADFSRGRGGEGPRRKEVHAILKILNAHQGPHLLMGDFNALAPGDTLKASHLLRYLVAIDNHHKLHPQAREGHPSLFYVTPPLLRFLIPFMRLIPRSRVLSWFCDEIAAGYAPRGSINLLCSAGYVDCFRHANPRAWGFTCPAAAPAGRIDYLFADPSLASRLSSSKVVQGNGDVRPFEASDHLPVLAEFGVGVGANFPMPVEIEMQPGAPLARS